ncbi:sensor histidine kinase [Actinoplanes awajinensis]|nr:ATP-binding protein [Actinoplanes awajinensis]
MFLQPGVSAGVPGRMEILHATGLLDAGPVAALDRLTRLARRLVGASVAAVSLVGDEWQRSVSAHGTGGALEGERTTPLSHSYCRYVVQDDAPLIVADARLDPRLRDSPAIEAHQAVAYAGFPLRSPDGAVLGAFCVVDSERRDWTADELSTVSDLAGAAESEISLRLAYARELATAERDRQHQLVDDQNAFLQTVLDSLEAGVAACDSAGGLTLFNRAMRELVGDPPDGLVGRERARHYQIYTPDGRELIDELPLTRALAGETVRGQQLLIKQPAGWRRLVSNARPIETAAGHRLGAVVAVHDITEAYRAEQLRRARHAVAQVLSEATNATAAAVQAVAAITDSLGWAHGEYWKVTPDRKHIERHSAHFSGDHATLTGDRPLSYVLGEGLPGLVWSRNGEVWWNTGTTPDDLVASGRALPEAGIRVAVGVPVRSGRRTLGVLAFYTDQDLPYDSDTVGMLDAVAAHLGRFVERRWAEDMSLMLAEARRSFNRVVEQVDDYVWTVEAVAGEPVRLVYGSPNVTAVLGHGAPVTSGPPMTDRIHPDDAGILARFRSDLAGGGQAEMECRIIGYDGQSRWIWTRAKARSENDRRFVDGISTNVDDRRELAEQRELLLEEERRQVEQLRELDRMKDELAALVIHELRNPVGVIRGFSEMLVDSTSLTGAERRHATVIERTTLHLQTLVDDLLDLARLNAGHLTIDSRPIAAARLLREVLETHTPSAVVKRLRLVDRVTDELTVHADGGRLRQALDNLLSNAIKYTPDGGVVTVAARQDGDRIVIEVSDTGIGIPAEQYPHLFSRFFRASNATEAGIKGTGLGLAVTKAIVDGHGGAISAGPGADGGTTFAIWLPSGPPAD